MLNFIIALWAVGFGLMTLEIYLAFAKNDIIGFPSGVGSVVYGLISLVYAFAAYSYWVDYKMNNNTVSYLKATIMDMLAFTSSMISLLLSTINLLISKIPQGRILGGIGIALSLVAINIATLG